MKKKILAISICVCICFAFLAIPAFASSAPETTSASNVFGTLFDVGDGVYYTYPSFGTDGTNAPRENVTVYTPFTLGSTSFERGDTFRVVNNGIGSQYMYKNDVSVPFYGAQVSSPAFYESSYVNQSGASVSGTQSGTPSGLVPELADEVFSVGGGLISFVMSHWIVLIPVVAFLVILCIGAIRKLIKGV